MALDKKALMKLEALTFPAWVELVFGTKIVNGKLENFIADISV